MAHDWSGRVLGGDGEDKGYSDEGSEEGLKVERDRHKSYYCTALDFEIYVNY